MKRELNVWINSELTESNSEKLVLELSSGGRGLLTVKDEGQAIKPGMSAAIDLGLDGESKPWFTGYITKATPAEMGFTRIVVRELCYILSSTRAISLQHCTLSEVIKQLSRDTGLTFQLPDSDYAHSPIATFTTHGSGYQLLENLGRAFHIDDFIWYQNSDGSIYVGSYQDSRWFNKSIQLPQSAIIKQQGGNSIQVALFPALRPGVEVNGKRVAKLSLEDSELTLFWQEPETSDKRKMKAEFPELAAGFHLPRFGQVVSISDSAELGDLNTAFRPRIAADVQLLNEHGEPDLNVPIYKAVMLPVNHVGTEQGQLSTTTTGAIVELAFAYGRADKAFIRTVLGLGWSLPSFEPGEYLIQRSEQVQTRWDAAGNISQYTNQEHHTQSFHQTDEADVQTENYGKQTTNVNEHSSEYVGGKKLIESLGAIELLASDDMVIGTLSNGQFAVAGNLTQVMGKLREVVIGLDDKLNVLGNQIITVEKDIEASAKNMRYTADLIEMNGGKGVVQGDCICALTGLPHSDLSTTVKAGK